MVIYMIHTRGGIDLYRYMALLPMPFCSQCHASTFCPELNSPIRSSFELALLMHTHKSGSLSRLFVCSSSFFLLWAPSWDPPIAQSASPKEDLIAYAPLASPPHRQLQISAPRPLNMPWRSTRRSVWPCGKPLGGLPLFLPKPPLCRSWVRSPIFAARPAEPGKGHAIPQFLFGAIHQNRNFGASPGTAPEMIPSPTPI